MKVLVFVAAIAALALHAPALAHDDERLADIEERLADVEVRLAEIERLDCLGRRLQAVSYAAGPVEVWVDTAWPAGISAPAMWDGHPFIVDIAHTLPNPHQMLRAVRQEAEKIRDALGYEVIVAGGVRYLPDLTRAQAAKPDDVFLVAHQHIEIRCCDDDGYGVAYPWWRLILLPTLEGDDAAFMGGHAMKNLIHELYHVLGFAHAGERGGVPMSE